jgi:mannose-6-phosphate isomerase-like protein (cupin superfamily)
MHVAALEEARGFVTLDGSTIREVAGAVSLPAENQSLAEAAVPPGRTTAEHYHRTSEELYFFTSGTGRVHVGDEQREVHAGDCVLNTGAEPLRLLCCCAPAYSDDDTVLTGG